MNRLTPMIVWCLATNVVVPANLLWASDSVVDENKKAGTAAWEIRATQAATAREIEGYASLTSVNIGGTIKLFVSTAEPNYSIRVFRIGWYSGAGGREVMTPVTRTGTLQPMPSPQAVTQLIECNWSDPYVLNIPTSWTSGYYLVKLTALSSQKQSYIIFVVRDDARASKVLLQSSVTTFQAYNEWGGRSLYGPPPRGAKASFDRPYGFAIPSGFYQQSPDYGSGQFFRYEANFLRWLEREGYDVTYTTDIDTHTNPPELLQHPFFLISGHDEYWSSEMRSAVETARNGGVHIGVFGANVGYWQIRFENSQVTNEPHRTIVEYRHNHVEAQQLPPEPIQNDPLLTTARFRDDPILRPEATLFGVMYAPLPSPNSTLAEGNIVVDSSSHWLFSGTGLHHGDILEGLLGYETDRLDAGSGAPANTVRLTHSPYEGSYANMSVYRHSSGALVFATGTMHWSWGLDDLGAGSWRKSRLNRAAQQITRNFLSYSNGGPIANAGGPYSSTTGQPVAFDGTGSTPTEQGAPISSYAWTFGDGTTGSGPAPSHTYASSGEYLVTLTVTDSNGGTGVATTRVNGETVRHVVWMNAVKTKVEGSTLTKTGSASAWDAGASSTKAIASGDGFAEFTAMELSARVFGLSSGDSSQTDADVDFGVFTTASGELYVSENGAVSGPFGSYVAGDRFRVAIAAGVVKYLRNGVVFRTSTGVPVYPLLVDTSLSNPNARVTNAVIAGRLAGNSIPSAAAGGPYSGSAGAPIRLVGSASDLDGSIVEYRWDFDDGKFGSGANLRHTYQSPGSYTASLTVKDDDGAIATATASVTVSGSTLSVQNVEWTGAQNVTVNGNSLTKTSGGVAWDAGAVSTRGIAAGDGYAEFTASETTLNRIFGLSHGDTNGSYEDIDFGIYADQTGHLYVIENGVLSAPWSVYNTGDVLRVSVEGGSVRYLRNGTPLSPPSSKSPRYPLLVDTSISMLGGTISNAKIAATAFPQNIVWTDGTNVTVTGNSVTKTSGAVAWDAGATSTTGLASGDGYAEFTVGDNTTNKVFGLSQGQTSHQYQDIDFGIYAYSSGWAYVIENGVHSGGDGLFTYSAGDRFRISVEGRVVRYSRNGTTFHTSVKPPAYPLFAEVAISMLGGTVLNGVMMGEDLTDRRVVWTHPEHVTVTGNTLTKTSGQLAWDAGASSTKAIGSGRGYAEFTAIERTTNRIFGLNHTDSDNGYTDIDFAVYAYSSGEVYVVESGTVRGPYTDYQTGDRLRVAVDAGQVTYLRNGTPFATGLTAAKYPLRVDSSISFIGGTITDAVLVADDLVWNATWQNRSSNAAIAGANTLVKTSGAGWDAGASSVEGIAYGNGYVDFILTATDKSLVFGLSNGDTNQTDADVDFGVYVHTNGSAYVIHSGVVSGPFAALSPGDRLRVAIDDGVISYSRNGVVFYSSPQMAEYPLRIDTSILSATGRIVNALLSGFVK